MIGVNNMSKNEANLFSGQIIEPDLGFERCDKELLKMCCDVIDAETKKLKRKPNKNAELTMDIDKKRDSLCINRLANQTNKSYLEDMFKTL